MYGPRANFAQRAWTICRRLTFLNGQPNRSRGCLRDMGSARSHRPER
jgi:hypothetical protein